MKKIIRILAAVSVCACMVLTACSKPENNNNNSNNNHNNNSNNNASVGDDVGGIGNDNNGNSAIFGNGIGGVGNDDDDDGDDGDDNYIYIRDVEFIHSTVDENGKFTCELLGIGADFDTSVWEFYTDEELAVSNGIPNFSAENIKSAFEKSGALQDMAALQNDGTNIMLIYEDTNVTKLGDIREEKYIDQSIDQLESALVGMVDNVRSERVNVTVGGQSHAALDVTGETEGMTVHNRTICIKKGNLFALINISAFNMDAINGITSMFYAL